LGANINRSPTAYLANPAAERARYAHDTDKTLTLLKVLDADGRCAPLRRSCGTVLRAPAVRASRSDAHQQAQHF